MDWTESIQTVNDAIHKHVQMIALTSINFNRMNRNGFDHTGNHQNIYILCLYLEVRSEFYTIGNRPTYLTVMADGRWQVAAGSKGENALNMPTSHNKYVCRPIFFSCRFLVSRKSLRIKPLNSRKFRHSTRWNVTQVCRNRCYYNSELANFVHSFSCFAFM